MLATTYYTDPLERYTESAWRRFDFEQRADLAAICKFLKIRLRKKLMDADICGVFAVTPKGWRVIEINTGLPVPRQCFTLAHEIGHNLLLPAVPHPGTICKLRTNGPAPEQDKAEERRCDRFAASLLMPHWLVKEWWEDLKGNPGYRVEIMATRFGVSKCAMRRRLRELNLVTFNIMFRV